MRIGFLTPFNPAAFPDRLGPAAPDINRGATAVHILVDELLAAGHEIHVFTSYPGKGPVRRYAGGGLHVVAVPRSGRFPVPGKRLAVARRLRRVLAPYVVRHRVEADMPAGARPDPALLQAIREMDGFQALDLLHAQWTYEYALAAAAFADRIPTFCSVRDWAPYQLSMARGFKFRTYWAESLLIARKVLRNKHIRFIANSEYTRGLLSEDAPDREISLIPNPIAADSILPERDVYPDHPVVVSVCQSIDARKNIGTLLEAFRLYRDLRPTAELHLGGKDFVPGHPRLLALGGLPEGTVLEGWLDRKALNGLLDRASVLVQPSLEETFGNVLLEGMARRLPVVGGQASGAVPAVLGHGRYGILCDVTDPRALCAALVEAEGRPNLDAATERLRKEFSSGGIAARHLALYEAALAPPGPERNE